MSQRRDDFCSIALASGQRGASRYNRCEEGPEPHGQARRRAGAHAPHYACNEPGKAGCRTRPHLPAGQKYERGANRIGASRLQQMSHILQVPVEFFFEGAPDASAPHGSNGSALSMAQINDFISDSDGLRMIGAFMRIDNAALRRRIVMLVQEIAGDDY